MICKKCGKENENDAIFCEACGEKLVEEKQEVKVVSNTARSYESYEATGLVKRIVLSCARKILDIVTGFLFVVCALGFIGGIIQIIVSLNSYYSYEAVIGVWIIVSSIVLFISTVLSNYFIYLLIDIKDSLRTMVNNRK